MSKTWGGVGKADREPFSEDEPCADGQCVYKVPGTKVVSNNPEEHGCWVYCRKCGHGQKVPCPPAA